MTLHEEEVEVIGLAVLQVALCSHIVQIHSDLGDGVCGADVQDADTVDVQINVVVTGEGEVQVLIFVVDELCVAFQSQTVVRFIVEFCPIIRICRNHIAVNIAGQAITPGLNRVKAVIGLGVTTRPGIRTRLEFCMGNGAGLSVVDFAIGIIILSAVIGGVEDIVGLAVFSLLNQVDVLILVDGHTVAVTASSGCVLGTVTPSVVQQEVSCVVPGFDIFVNAQLAAVELCLGSSVGTIATSNFLADLGSQGFTAQLTQFMAGDKISIISTIRIALSVTQRLLHIGHNVVHRCLGIDGLTFLIQGISNQVGTDIGTVNGLLCAAGQNLGQRGRRSGRVIAAVQNQIGARDVVIIHQIVVLGIRSCCQHGEACVVSLIIDSSGTSGTYNHGQGTAA